MSELEKGLVGHWKLTGDCRDYSGKGNHGINHGVDLDSGKFNGRDSCIEVIDSDTMRLNSEDFTICAAVNTEKDLHGFVGDILSKFDAPRRKGINLCISASSGGYNSQGDDKHIHFGIDNGRTGEWEYCGKPSETSRFVTSLTVFDGGLFVGSNNAPKEEDWCHVFRYRGSSEWEDCGRVGKLRTQGVGPMIVHDGHLYAATQSLIGDRKRTIQIQGKDYSFRDWKDLDSGRVYRFKGPGNWEDCGQPGECPRLFSLASFRGRLYIIGVDDGALFKSRCYVYEGGKQWKSCGEWDVRTIAMAVHDDRLFVSTLGPKTVDPKKGGAVYAYDGKEWESLGNPFGTQERCDQIHCMEIYMGEIYAGICPQGDLAVYRNGAWEECGRLENSREPNGLTVYNGKFYNGSLPRADIYRYEGEKKWTLIKTFLEEEIDPGEPIPGFLFSREVKENWARVTSLTVYDGKLFASTGSCYGTVTEAPHGIRGKVFCFEAGKSVSYDHDFGSGWGHVTAVREGDRLKLHINGNPAVESSSFDPKEYDLSNDVPLKIGFGELDYFSGSLRDIRLYNRALSDEEVKKVSLGAGHKL